MVLLISSFTYLSNSILLQLNMPALYRMTDIIAQVFIASAVFLEFSFALLFSLLFWLIFIVIFKSLTFNKWFFTSRFNELSQS